MNVYFVEEIEGYQKISLAFLSDKILLGFASGVSDFKRKFGMLQRLKQEQYKYTRTFNGLKYYWLPVEDLP